MYSFLFRFCYFFLAFNDWSKLIHSLYFAHSFLDEAERVASLRYSPTDDDIIRARLRTVGVQEHSIVLESGPEPGREWIIYDVGGTRSMVCVLPLTS